MTPVADGFAVVDRQSSMIRLFDERGQRSASVGSPGPGPGEFSRTIYHAVSVGNDLWVPDMENRRVNLIDISARAWVDSRPFNLALGFPQTWLSLPGDEIVGFIGSLGFGPEPNSSRVVRWTGQSLEEAFSWTDEGEATGWAGATLVVPGPSKATVAILDRLGGGIRVHDLAGNIVSRYAFGEGAAAPLAVDDREYLEGLVADRRARRARDVARRVAQMEELAPEGARGAVTRMIADTPPPSTSVFGEHYPFFLDARFDARTGTIWLARPLTVGQIREMSERLDWSVVARSAKYWDAYALDGSFLYRLEFPPGFIVTAYLDGRFYGYEVDALGRRTAAVLSVP